MKEIILKDRKVLLPEAT